MSTTAAAFLLVTRSPRRDFMDAALVPPAIVTTSTCLAAIAPGTWGIAWTNDSAEERAARGAQFGLAGPSLDAFVAWCTRAFGSAVGFPGIFFDREAALAAHEASFRGREDVLVVGLGIPRDRVEELLLALRPRHGEEPSATVTMLEQGLPLPEGELLGYEVLCEDYGTTHSYLCNGLEKRFAEVLGMVPNEHGLYTREEATRGAAFAGSPAVGAEPGLWLPWEVVRYSAG